MKENTENKNLGVDEETAKDMLVQLIKSAKRADEENAFLRHVVSVQIDKLKKMYFLFLVLIVAQIALAGLLILK